MSRLIVGRGLPFDRLRDQRIFRPAEPVDFGGFEIWESTKVPPDAIYFADTSILLGARNVFEMRGTEEFAWWLTLQMRLHDMQRSLKDHLAELVRETEERLFG